MCKRAISVLLAVLMMLSMLLVGCGSSEKEDTKPVLTENTTSTDEKAIIDPEDMYEVTMAFFTFGNTPTDILLVEEELNKITMSEVGAKIKLLPISFGNWDQQTKLMLSSGEKLDLLPMFSSSVSGYVANGQLIFLNELLDQQGQGIIEVLGEDIAKVANVDGDVYGVTTLRDWATSSGIVMRKDLVEKYGIDVSQIKTLDDIEKVFEIVKAGEPGMEMLAGTQGSPIIDRIEDYDWLTDKYGVLMECGQSLEVVNRYETEEYKEQVYKMRDWYNKGYIMKDTMTNTETAANLVKAGKLFAYFSPLKPGFAVQEKLSTTYDMVTATLSEPYLTTTNTGFLTWGIPINCQNTEKTMEVLNLAYSNADFMNLLDWGIEGKHYQVIDEENDIIDFAEGVDASNSGYNLGLGWAFPNQFITHIWNGNSTSLWTELNDFNMNATKSLAYGFAYDPSNVVNEITAVANVITEYAEGLGDGVVDPDEYLPKFIADLKAAGMDKIVTEKQAQLDKWLEENGKSK